MMHPKAQHYVDEFGLLPHPEGGWFKETYRSSGVIPQPVLEGFGGERPFSTAIYFLITAGNFSAFHRIKSDEMWHFYDGAGLLIHELTTDGAYHEHRLGLYTAKVESPQLMIPANSWFASEVMPSGSWCLVGCTVSPGFDFADFEMGTELGLLETYPEHASLIRRLTRT